MFSLHIPNAVRAIAELASSFHNADGSVAIDGFYDDVRPLTAEEKADIAAVNYKSDDAFMVEAGITEITGEDLPFGEERCLRHRV